MGSKNDRLFDITALSAATGVNASTLRSWEARYNLLAPARSDTGRRLYNDDDMTRVSLTRDLLKAGHKLTALATKSIEELGAIELPAEKETEDFGATIKARLDAAITNGEPDEYTRYLRVAFGVLPPLLAVDLYAGTMRMVGELWSSGKLDIGREHLLSAAGRDVVREEINRFTPAATRATLAFATLPKELHECGLLAGRYLAAANGLKTIYFGPDMPIADMAANVIRQDAKILVISSVYSAEPGRLRGDVTGLAEALAGQAAVWVCAQRNEMTTALPSGVTLVSTYQDFWRRLAAVSPQHD